MRTPLALAASLFIGSLLHAAPQGVQSEAAPRLFRDVPAGIGQDHQDQTAARERAVEIDVDLLRDTFARTGNSGIVRMGLFPDVSAKVQFDRIEPAFGGGFVWFGVIGGDPESDVLLSVVEDTVHGSIRWGDVLYRVRYAGDGVHRVSQVDELRFQSCGNNSSHEVRGVDRGARSGSGPGLDNPSIDVMVVYSTQAKNIVGGSSAMASLINLAVTETNQAYTTSTATQQITLVHTEEMVGYTEPSSFSTILSHLRGKTDGKMDEVHALRDQHAADAVAMICANGQYCGMAYQMVGVSAGFESSAFSVTSHSCATGYYSFGHELGHNFGSHHDPANAGSAAYNYSYGFRTSNSQWRTVMAYSPGTRVKRFSSPNATWSGYVMGNALQDNARSLNNTASTVADWRSGPAIVTYCTAGTSAAGCQAALSATGSASASAPSGFTVSASSVEGQRNGLLFYAQTGRQAIPWGSGTSLQCVTPPVRRGGLRTGNGTSGACDASFSQDLNARWCPTCPKPSHGPVSGQKLQLQLWYRDPQNTSNRATSLSDALEVDVAP